jgi:excisionase family DNA binding protein
MDDNNSSMTSDHLTHRPAAPDLVAHLADALTPAEVAEMLGVKLRTVVTRILRGELRCYEPFAGRRLIARADLAAWLATKRLDAQRPSSARAIRNPDFARGA